MQISPEQGSLLQMLVRLIGARRTIEVGVFTGYSALAVALALPDDGRVLACDISDEFTRVGRPYWERAHVASKIDLVLAPALETLDARIAAGEAGVTTSPSSTPTSRPTTVTTSAACGCCASAV